MMATTLSHQSSVADLAASSASEKQSNAAPDNGNENGDRDVSRSASPASVSDLFDPSSSFESVSLAAPCRHGEVPAQQAAVNVLLDLEGRVLSVQSTAFVGLELLSALPSVGASQAEQVARASFRTETGRMATRVTAPRLVWSAPLDAVGLPLVAQPRLAWYLEAYDEPAGSDCVAGTECG
jgi:hypothetical protein